MKIDVLYSLDCPHYKIVLGLIHEVLAETGIEAQVEPVRVDTEADAQRLQFAGSPTVFVDGLDVDYTDPHLNPLERKIGLHCRSYQANGGTQAWPTRQMLRETIEMAHLVDMGQFGRCC